MVYLYNVNVRVDPVTCSPVYVCVVSDTVIKVGIHTIQTVL